MQKAKTQLNPAELALVRVAIKNALAKAPKAGKATPKWIARVAVRKTARKAAFRALGTLKVPYSKDLWRRACRQLGISKLGA